MLRKQKNPEPRSSLPVSPPRNSKLETRNSQLCSGVASEAAKLINEKTKKRKNEKTRWSKTKREGCIHKLADGRIIYNPPYSEGGVLLLCSFALLSSSEPGSRRRRGSPTRIIYRAGASPT